jgi:hypothetical protein
MAIVGGNSGATILHEREDAWGIYHPIGDTGTVTKPFSPDLRNFSLNFNVKDTDDQGENHKLVR